MITALRIFLEIVGITALISIALFYAFPGALEGIGMTEAVRSAQTAAAETSTGASQPVVAPADMVAVLLTVVTIMLGVVAFIVSIAALVGYNAIKESATVTARGAALAKVEEIAPQVARSAAETVATAVAAEVAAEATVGITEAVLRRLRTAADEEKEQGEGLRSGESADAYAEMPPGTGRQDPS